MAKLKTSITLEKDLVEALDERARVEGKNRSELIEQFIIRGLTTPDHPMVEFYRLSCMPSQLIDALSIANWHDDDGPVELVLRVPETRYEHWWNRRTPEKKP